MRTGQTRRFLGGVLVALLSVHAGLAAGLSPSEAGATLRGLVVTVPPGPEPVRQPVTGATVRAVDVSSGRSWSSSASATDGAYSIEGLPPGQFAVAVETKNGVFLGDGLVGLAAGQERRLSFSLKADPDPGGGTTPPTPPPPPPPTPPEGSTPPPPPPPAKGKSWWAQHPWLGGLTVVGTAVGLGVLADSLTDEDENNEPNASKAAP